MRSVLRYSSIALLATVIAAACSDESVSPATSGPFDAGLFDAGPLEAGPPDVSVVEAGAADSDVVDADGPDTDVPPMKTWTVEKTPVNVALWRVWGSGPNDVYAVGDGGTILHSTGKGDWVLQPVDTHAVLAGISGSGAGDVYVTGVFGCANLECDADGGQIQGGFFHSSGDGTWQVLLPEVFNALSVWSLGSDDTYVMGTGWTDDFVYHGRANGAWVEAKLPSAGIGPRRMWASSPGDMYILGQGFTLLHSTGDGSWSDLGLPVNEVFSGMWGSGPDDVYLVGDNSTIAHLGSDGKWLIQPVPQLKAWPHSVWGSGPDDVWVVTGGFFTSGDILHSSGDGRWTLAQIGDVPSLFDVWGSGRDDVYAVGANGTILHLK